MVRIFLRRKINIFNIFYFYAFSVVYFVAESQGTLDRTVLRLALKKLIKPTFIENLIFIFFPFILFHFDRGAFSIVVVI